MKDGVKHEWRMSEHRCADERIERMAPARCEPKPLVRRSVTYSIVQYRELKLGRHSGPGRGLVRGLVGAWYGRVGSGRGLVGFGKR
jgi:hypothetical protein